MSQPTITLNTPSGATVELRAHRVCSISYSATVSINNTTVAFSAALTTHELDDKNLILDHAHIPLLPESVERVRVFLNETASYINGGEV